MSDLILLKVQQYLTELKNDTVSPNNDILNAFADSAKTSLSRHVVSPNKEREFRLRMSNLGRPGCALQAEKLGLRRDPSPYSDRFRMAYGDIVEQAAVVVLYHAGVNIVSAQKAVSLEISGEMINGTYDLIIAEPEPKLYDIKSASSYAFNNKYNGKNLKNVWDEGDAFGYVTQNYCYSDALRIPSGGLIVINKETGEWCIVSPPLDDTELRIQALKRASDNVRRIVTDQPFIKDFSDHDEIFRKVKTGNKVLHQTCSFCDYKRHCWPTVKTVPQVVSKGQNPRLVDYTFIDERYNDRSNTE